MPAEQLDLLPLSNVSHELDLYHSLREALEAMTPKLEGEAGELERSTMDRPMHTGI
jgi:hypothetical protein